jgi:hypothetical protein
MAGGSLGSGSEALFAGFSDDSVAYKMPPGFKEFEEISSNHYEFYKILKEMENQPPLPPVQLFDEQEEADGKNVEEKQRNMITELKETVEMLYDGMTHQPLGAMFVEDNLHQTPQKPGMMETIGLLKEALGSKALGIVQDPLGSMMKTLEYALLLSYSTSVFSNYATARPDSNGKTKEDLSGIEFPKSVTGVTLSPEVNYFFQSEWEYLYHGEKNAGSNLSSVMKLLFLVRMVCNYITVFRVDEVKTVIAEIKATFSFAPPLGFVLGELARAAFVAAESLVDVSLLRSGHKVPLVKNGKSEIWICSPSGMKNAFDKINSSEFKEFLLYGITGSRKNRNIFAAN